MKKISMRSSPDLTLDEAFEQFIKMCKLKNLSPKTTETYKTHYSIFKKFIDGQILVLDCWKRY